MNATFTEIQKFTQWWFKFLLLILILIWGLVVYGIYQQVVLEEPFGTKPSTDIELILVTLLISLLILFFFSIQLTTAINEQGIQLRFFPFVRKKISWKDIESTEMITYKFAGGLGILLNTKHGTIYNVQGNEGLSVQLKSGKRFLIGTQKSAELKKVINQLS